jgi:hypothetical protein
MRSSPHFYRLAWVGTSFVRLQVAWNKRTADFARFPDKHLCGASVWKDAFPGLSYDRHRCTKTQHAEDSCFGSPGSADCFHHRYGNRCAAAGNGAYAQVDGVHADANDMPQGMAAALSTSGHRRASEISAVERRRYGLVSRGAYYAQILDTTTGAAHRRFLFSPFIFIAALFRWRGNRKQRRKHVLQPL